ncbi:MAG: prolipoprotein diacylglyceryl transferase [Anaerolineae bacterium]|nr:prolipoprotein diacylglyceryl transferase [Anaerolineae bacterium]
MNKVQGLLDQLVQPEIRLGHHSRSAFQVCGYTGLGLAVVLAMTLVAQRGLSPWVMGAVILAAMGTFLSLALATKIVSGGENLVYYHHEIAVILVTTGLLWLLRQPVLPYLDITILGVGMFLVCGRIGCLMVGCCHGRPHAWGVCYGQAHATAGFESYLVGVRLFPVQAVESLWTLAITLVGAGLVWMGQPAGAALAWYIVMYDLGRFTLEFLRGDAARPYHGVLSEAQWISLLLMLVVVAAEWLGVLPLHAWHGIVAGGLILTMVALVRRQRAGRAVSDQLLRASHIQEVAEAIAPATDEPAIHVRRTSLGIHISVGQINTGAAPMVHYALSSAPQGLNAETAGRLAALIAQLRHSGQPAELIQGGQGVYHLLVHSAASLSQG